MSRSSPNTTTHPSPAAAAARSLAGGASGERIDLRFPSDPANLAPAREALEKLALAGGLGATAAGEIGLVVNEALANVMRHAYRGATDKPVELTAWWQGDDLVVKIRDWGSGVHPLEHRPHPEKHNPLKPGGLGLICLKKLMHEVEFAPQPDGMLLTMKRKRTPVTHP